MGTLTYNIVAAYSLFTGSDGYDLLWIRMQVSCYDEVRLHSLMFICK